MNSKFAGHLDLRSRQDFYYGELQQKDSNLFEVVGNSECPCPLVAIGCMIPHYSLIENVPEMGCVAHQTWFAAVQYSDLVHKDYTDELVLLHQGLLI